MTTYNLAALLDDTADRHPDREAVVLGETHLTYAQVQGAANQVANLLVSRGIEPGDKVALSCPNLPYFTIAYYGILKAGGTVVPLNVLLKAREVAYHLEDSDAKAYFCFQGTEDLPIGAEGHKGFEQVEACTDFFLITADPAGEPTIEGTETMGRAMADQPATFEAVATDEDDTAVILYTSGTTGKPKGAELRHRNMRDNAMSGKDLFGADPENPDTYLCVLPLFHSFGQTVIQNGAFAFGGTVVMLPRFEAKAALSLMLSEKVSFFAGVPTMYWGLLGALADDDSVDVSSLADNLRVAAAGGSALPVEVHKRFQEKFGVTILEGYGLSETSPVASFSKYGADVRAGSIGLPIPGVEMALLEGDSWDEIEWTPEAVGEIAIKGHNVMKGYYDRPEATDEVIQDGWFRSGDLGRRDEDGWYYIVDRSKDMIIRGGYNVYPREIEETLMSHPAVSLAAVIGVPHDSHGEEIKAFVILEKGESVTEDELVAWGKEEMAGSALVTTHRVRSGEPGARRAQRARGFAHTVRWTLAAFAVPVVVLGLVGYLFVRAKGEELAQVAVVPRQLEAVAVVCAVLLVTWLAALVATYLATRPARPTRAQRVGGNVLTMLLSVAIVAPLATTGYYALVQAGTVETIAGDPRSATVPAIDGTAANPWGAKRRVNLLLLGGDGGVGRSGIRTDSVILVSMDTRTGRTVLFSLPRNLRDVPFPDGTELHELYPDGFDLGTDPGESMLNAIYRNVPATHPDAIRGSDNEGADALKLGVSGALGVPVDYYLLVNLRGFQQIVDAMGGITVNVNEKVPINGNTSAGIPPTGYISPGPDKRLDGFKALWFTRGRYGSTDYKRMERQRCAINAIVDEADPARLLLRYTKLADVGRRILRTDIPQDVLPAFVDTALKMKDEPLTSVVFQRSTQFDPNDPDYDVVHRTVQRALASAEQADRAASPRRERRTPRQRAGLGARVAVRAATGALPSETEARELLAERRQARADARAEGEGDSLEATTAKDDCAYHPETGDETDEIDGTSGSDGVSAAAGAPARSE
ncbi:hypothetical protein LUZ63_020285 [Rhynchospora breviuscula]|uniref:4-coumarate--CoA ligase n=1 Tax=Rhynchospora breviuscula TaxID=2022672 RepID=A0A9Q0BZX5_9POAL|nr:hypothetical protein LUZ63_020285 [Rhynchospora breviuscula]